MLINRLIRFGKIPYKSTTSMIPIRKGFKVIHSIVISSTQLMNE